MKIIAHRGWSAHENPNSLLAFRKAAESGIDGVEFDVRFATDDKSKIIVSHDPKSAQEALGLNEALSFLQQTNLELFIEIKQADEALPLRVGDKINKFELAGRTHIFGFKKKAIHLPWNKKQNYNLGAILINPLYVHQDINHFSPDVVLIGFDDRWWTRQLFWLYWSPETLSEFIAQYPNIDFVVGVVNEVADMLQVQEVEGVYGITTDKPAFWKKKLRS